MDYPANNSNNENHPSTPFTPTAVVANHSQSHLPSVKRASFFIGNMHCPSCVTAITSIIESHLFQNRHRNSASAPPVVGSSSSRRVSTSATVSADSNYQVDVSLLTGIATFEYPSDLDLSSLRDDLQQAGYNIESDSTLHEKGKEVARHSTTSLSSSLQRRSWWERWFASEREMQSKHNAACAACRAEHDYDGVHVDDYHQDLSTAKNPAATDASDSNWIKTTFTVQGMSCSSCIAPIEKALSSDTNPGIKSVQVTLLPASAVVIHDTSRLTIAQVQELIEDVGFDPELVSWMPLEPDEFNQDKLNNNNKHQQEDKKSISSSQLSSLLIDEPSSVTYDVLLSVTGMTCSSCVSAINNIVEKIPGVVGNVNVNLIGGTASLQVSKESAVDQIVEEIQDSGYGCEIVHIKKLSPEPETQKKPRQVMLHIDGMFCSDCLFKVKNALKYLSNDHGFTYSSFTLENPVTIIKYYPDPPNMSIRLVRETITNLGFNMSIVQPPSLEERSRMAQIRERRRILYRLIAAFVFVIPTFIIGVVFMMLVPDSNPIRKKFSKPVWGSASLGTIVMFSLATPVQFIIGWYFTEKAFRSLRSVWRPRKGIRPSQIWYDRLLRWGSMDSLVALGTWTAYIASVAYMALDISTPASHQDKSSEHSFFDTSVFLIFFILAGRYLEAFTKSRTGDAITELVKIKPATGLLLVTLAESQNGIGGANNNSSIQNRSVQTREVEVEFLEVGDMVLVPVGSSPPMDGFVESSSKNTDFDESSLTGESRPVVKQPGDQVYSGTINLGPNAVKIRITTRDTVVDGIVTAVRDAMGKKAEIERIAQTITGYFVPFVTTAAVFTFWVWIMRGYFDDLPKDWLEDARGSPALFAIQFGIATLVVACPCGIGLAAPTAQMVGVGLAAKFGILPKGGGEAFQEISRLNTIVFDKTGTLTSGTFTVSDTEIMPSSSNKNSRWTNLLIAICNSGEQASTHPLSVGLRNYCSEQLEKLSITKDSPENVELLNSQEIPGKGLIASVRVQDSYNIQVYLGNEKLMQDSKAQFDSDESKDTATNSLAQWKSQGKSVIVAAFQLQTKSDNPETYPVPTLLNFDSPMICALFAVQDPPRPEASKVVQELRKSGIDSWMISGDNLVTARAVASLIGINENNVIAGASPTEKSEHIKRIQNRPPAKIETDESRLKAYIKRKVFGINDQTKTTSIVGFVGDGVNDAAALTQADVGMAMGSGSTVALSSADFALLNPSLYTIVNLRALASATLFKIYQNFLYASVYNIILIPIAAGAFFDLGKTKLPPAWAALAMALSSVSVVLSSLLLRFFKPKKY